MTAVATACVAATSAALLSTAPASAAGGWDITPGGNFTATASPWQATDAGTGGTLSCSSLILRGQLLSGVAPTSAIGEFTGATFSNCSGGGGAFPLSLSLTGVPWGISATGYDQASGTVSGTIGGLGVHLSGTCIADIGGATPTAAGVSFTYRNATHILTIGAAGDLHVWNVTGLCLGLLNSGDSIAPEAFDVEPPQNIVPAG
ncbi:MAG: hypothetical protein FWE15_03210 [Actinomycetia bacterium]|nr:hypothetical protein [Actinomycetes bacterium]